MSESRGFAQFIGRTVVSVDEESINVVYFTLDNGEVISVDSEGHFTGIPVLVATKDRK